MGCCSAKDAIDDIFLIPKDVAIPPHLGHQLSTQSTYSITSYDTLPEITVSQPCPCPLPVTVKSNFDKELENLEKEVGIR